DWCSSSRGCGCSCAGWALASGATGHSGRTASLRGSPRGFPAGRSSPWTGPPDSGFLACGYLLGCAERPGDKRFAEQDWDCFAGARLSGH
ncbi:unnamed protein product, partial [Symbiodinium pilosum]